MYSLEQNLTSQRFSGTIKLPHVPRPRLQLCILADAAYVDR